LIIVGGEFTVDPAQRDVFIAGRLETMRASRQQDGCIDFTFSADPLDPSRVILFERWEDQASLDAHLAAPRPSQPGPAVAPSASTIMVYEVASERPLRR
jgi:quinol monooxygenase YgiN